MWLCAPEPGIFGPIRQVLHAIVGAGVQRWLEEGVTPGLKAD